MTKKKICAFVSVLLVMSIAISGCGILSMIDTSSSASSGSGASGGSVAPQMNPIQRVYEYVKAVLKYNHLQITILNNESAASLLDDYSKIQYDVPYSVSGLTGTYKDMSVGTIGQEVWPYVFLLTNEGDVECVPVADAIYASESNSNSSAEIAFQSSGVLQGISNVVSFNKGSVTDEYGGYATMFAECADSAVYDLSYPIYFEAYPEERPASDEASLRMLMDNTDVAQLVTQGMKPWRTGEINYLYGEYCSLFSVDANHTSHISPQRLYGVGASGAIYSYNAFSEEWAPANYLAAVYSAAEAYSDLFVVITDPNSSVYQQCKDTATLISTPVVGLEASEPVLLLPLKTKMNLKVEMMADSSGDYYSDAADTFFDGTVSRKTLYLIGVTLSETKSVLRITASWNDGLDDMVAVWYAVYKDGSAKYTQYVGGNHLEGRPA